jgi:hypothetical protein
LFFAGKNDQNVTLEKRETLGHHSPNNFEIHAKIFMDKNVSERGDASPGDLGILLLDVPGKIPDRFADDLQVSNDGILDHRVPEKGAPPPLVYFSIFATASRMCFR